VRSLFLKMFLWFWATAIVTGIALVLAFTLGPGSVPSLWVNTLTETARNAGQATVARIEAGGHAATRQGALRSCLFDSRGNEISGAGCDTLLDMVSRVGTSTPSAFNIKNGLTRVAVRLEGEGGRQYIYATELPAGPRAAFGISRARIGVQWGVAFLVSGLVCFLLTRYLTAPIIHLRKASQQLTAGKWGVRAPASIGDRRDEIGGLVHDFNTMADRIESLISQQRQLLSDISHELRSPLARLNVALDLSRERNGNDSAFDHMEQDLASLNETIARLLTVAALDSNPEPIQKEPVNFTELVRGVAEDARFESQRRGVDIQVTVERDFQVLANPKLLHSAIENVIRNATHYTPPESPVTVQLTADNAASSASLRLTVRDHGPGVPQAELANIFKPFYRVAGARDRQSGGTGLGLAIADRVIRLHGGKITASNQSPRGLQIEIVMPRDT
jgi:two-component system, OmpR family, sensor histidine kinase CpxA